MSRTRKRLDPIHPGEVLLTEFLEPLGLTQYRLAKSLKVPGRRINEIVHGTRAISADTALRLARFFGTSDRFVAQDGDAMKRFKITPGSETSVETALAKAK